MPKILLVDDSTTAVALFQVFLAGKDTHLHVARDGAEALDAARRIVPDLIVSDVEMPRMDGFELCAAVRRDPRLSRVPVVLLTSRTDGASRRRGEEVGASAFLTKPASPAAVRSTVDALLRAERARDATGMPSAAAPVRASPLAPPGVQRGAAVQDEGARILQRGDSVGTAAEAGAPAGAGTTACDGLGGS